MAKNKIKILLIEDDPFLLSMYMAKFELENFKVITADNGEKGLKMAAKEMPDVILLDIILPKINGIEILKALKSDKKLKNVLVIMLTNLSQKEEITQCLNIGAEDYLIKARFMPSEAVEKIKKVLNK